MNYSQNRNFKIYIDFDGTITNKDIGEHMFLKFGDAAESKNIIQKWLDNKLTSQQVWIKLCNTVKDFNEREFDKFLDDIAIDPDFNAFVDYAKKNNLDLFILSDGLDFYINKVSKRENFSDLTIYCNKLEIDNSGNLIPHFPYTDEECKQCANCKRNHILNSSSDDDITIYIGDGWSDTCAAEHCDFIFAKKSLLKYCVQNGLPYYPFETFKDVQKIVEQLRAKKKIKKRHQAAIKRKDVYIQG